MLFAVNASGRAWGVIHRTHMKEKSNSAGSFQHVTQHFATATKMTIDFRGLFVLTFLRTVETICWSVEHSEIKNLSTRTHTHTPIRTFTLTPISTFLCRQGGCYADSGFQEVLQVLRTDEGSVPKSSPQTNADSPPKCYHMQLFFDFCQQKCGSNHAVLWHFTRGLSPTADIKK